MAKSPIFVRMDLSTAKHSSEKACVDLKFLQRVFKNYKAADIEDIKLSIKQAIDSCQSVDEIAEVVETEIYMIQIATKFSEETASMHDQVIAG